MVSSGDAGIVMSTGIPYIGNDQYFLSVIVLVIVYSADRNLNKHSTFLNPDVAATSTNIFDPAIAWIKN